MIAVLYVTMFSRIDNESQGFSLLPFHFICRDIRCVKVLDYYGVFNPLFGVFLNILTLVLLGYFLKRWKPELVILKVVLTRLGFSMGIECIQLIAKLGMSEINDLITNKAGMYISCRIAKRYVNE